MKITVEEYIKAVTYMLSSPFVKKIEPHIDDGDAQITLAKKIYASSAMISSVKKDHENVLNVLEEVYKGDDEPYVQALEEKFKQEEKALLESIQKKEKELKELPTVDEKYIEKCENLKKEVAARIKNETNERTNAIENEYEKQKESIDKMSLWGSFFLVIGLSGLWLMRLSKGFGFMFCLLSAFGGGMSVCLGISLRLATPFYKKEKEKRITQAASDVEKKYMPVFTKINEDMKRGYDSRSGFLLDVQKRQGDLNLELAIDAVKNIQYFKKREYFIYSPQSSIDLMKKTLENFDALNTWAANYVRDKAQADHNRKMLQIEQDRYYEQKVALEGQAREMQKQNDLLREQARAAKEQAEAAKASAKDTEEIRRRMENERYGDFRKHY